MSYCRAVVVLALAQEALAGKGVDAGEDVVAGTAGDSEDRDTARVEALGEAMGYDNHVAPG